MKQKLNRGFTLIELLVVIAIIGILASVVLASLNTARDKAAIAAYQAEVLQVVTNVLLQCDGTGGSFTTSAGGHTNAITSTACTAFDDGTGVAVAPSNTLTPACTADISVNGADFTGC